MNVTVPARHSIDAKRSMRSSRRGKHRNGVPIRDRQTTEQGISPLWEKDEFSRGRKMHTSFKALRQAARLIARPEKTGSLDFLQSHDIGIPDYICNACQIFSAVESPSAMNVIGAHRKDIARFP